MLSRNCVPVVTHIGFGEEATKAQGLSVPPWLFGVSHSPRSLCLTCPEPTLTQLCSPKGGRLAGVGDVTSGCTVRGCPGLFSVDFHVGSSSARQLFPHSRSESQLPVSSGAWYLQKPVPRCFGPTPIAHGLRPPAGKPQACICTVRMKAISRQSEELPPWARDAAGSEWADCWAEETGTKALATNPMT